MMKIISILFIFILITKPVLAQEPTATPTVEPTATPTIQATSTPLSTPTPTPQPTRTPTPRATATPTSRPSSTPTMRANTPNPNASQSPIREATPTPESVELTDEERSARLPILAFVFIVGGLLIVGFTGWTILRHNREELPDN